MVLIFVTFVVLVVLTAAPQRSKDIPLCSLTDTPPLVHPQWGTVYRTKSLNDWVLDGIGLLMQGIAIPVLQIAIIYHVWTRVLPAWGDRIHLPWALQFLISFVLVDYLYYWNHRLLHSRYLWFAHRVHHTVTKMDVLGTSRNTIWSSFLILYLWVHGLMIYAIDDPTGYVFGVSLTASLDLWRHSRLSLPAHRWRHQPITQWLIVPHDHAQHHSSNYTGYNFGANLNIWDKLHRTYRSSNDYPEQLGIQVKLPLLRQLLAPFSKS